MWTPIKAAYAALRVGAARSIVATVLALFVGLVPAPSHAQDDNPQYVKICTLYGANFFYIPGTDTCLDSAQVARNQFLIARAATRAATGIAMSASLVRPFLPDGTNFAVSMHWAGFDGQHAVGFSGLMRLWGNLSLSAGVAVGLDQGRLNSFTERTQTEFGTSVPAQSWSEIRVLARTGLMYSW